MQFSATSTIPLFEERSYPSAEDKNGVFFSLTDIAKKKKTRSSVYFMYPWDF